MNNEIYLENKELYFKTLLESLEGNKELLIELKDYAIDYFPSKFIELEEAVFNKKYNDVIEIAHAMKGEVGYFLADKLHDLASAMELMGKESNLENASEILTSLKKEIDNLVDTLGKIA